MTSRSKAARERLGIEPTKLPAQMYPEKSREERALERIHDNYSMRIGLALEAGDHAFAAEMKVKMLVARGLRHKLKKIRHDGVEREHESVQDR